MGAFEFLDKSYSILFPGVQSMITQHGLYFSIDCNNFIVNIYVYTTSSYVWYVPVGLFFHSFWVNDYSKNSFISRVIVLQPTQKLCPIQIIYLSRLGHVHVTVMLTEMR